MSELVLTVRGPDATVRVARFPQAEVEVGRSPHTLLTLDHPAVSTVHARFLRRDAGYVVLDEQSADGTYVNETRITAPTPVTHGTSVRVGPFTIEVAIDDGQGFTTDLATADRMPPPPPEPQGRPWTPAEIVGVILATAAIVSGVTLLLT